MLICSYYTSPLYKRFGERMKASAEKLGLLVHLAPEKDRGDWYVNRSMMPGFILETLLAHPEQDGVCWVDADAVFHKVPEKLMNSPAFDVAGYPDPVAKEVFWAVLYFRQSPNGIQALKNWQVEVGRWPHVPHHRTYNEAVRKTPGVIVEKLPVDYCYIRRHHVCAEPVIENLAISRMTPAMREELLK